MIITDNTVTYNSSVKQSMIFHMKIYEYIYPFRYSWLITNGKRLYFSFWLSFFFWSNKIEQKWMSARRPIYLLFFHYSFRWNVLFCQKHFFIVCINKTCAHLLHLVVQPHCKSKYIQKKENHSRPDGSWFMDLMT